MFATFASTHEAQIVQTAAHIDQAKAAMQKLPNKAQVSSVGKGLRVTEEKDHDSAALDVAQHCWLLLTPLRKAKHQANWSAETCTDALLHQFSICTNGLKQGTGLSHTCDQPHLSLWASERLSIHVELLLL